MDNRCDESSSSRLYDYIEGTMDSVERAQLESELAVNPSLRAELEKYKNFLTLLHMVTGKITLSAEEVKAKIDEVIRNTRDYEAVMEETYFDRGRPQKMMSARVWFKAPNLYRVEGMSPNPVFGDALVIVRGTVSLNWIKGTDKATKISIDEKYMSQMYPNFAEELQQMAADKRSRLLGTEYIQGRPALHVQFTEVVNTGTEMNTHFWMDRETWMPLMIEQYNADGELVRCRVIRELRLNQGIADDLFEFNLPPEVMIDDQTEKVVNPPQKIDLNEAALKLGFSPYMLADAGYIMINYWITVENMSAGVLLTHYHRPGEQLPCLSISQGAIPHSNIPPQMEREQFVLSFDQQAVPAEFVKYGIGSIDSMVIWECRGLYFSCGGTLDLPELVKCIGELRPMTFPEDDNA